MSTLEIAVVGSNHMDSYVTYLAALKEKWAAVGSNLAHDRTDAGSHPLDSLLNTKNIRLLL